MTWDQLVELGRELPEVAVGVWYRTPSLQVRGKSFCRLKEDGESLVLVLDDIDEQDVLIAARPETYFITDHYRGYPAILARPAKLPVAEARTRLVQSWRKKAPPALVKRFDGAAR